jgi:hypothetical protein
MISIPPPQYRLKKRSLFADKENASAPGNSLLGKNVPKNL